MNSELIARAEAYAAKYDDDDRPDIKADVLNAYYAGAALSTEAQPEVTGAVANRRDWMPDPIPEYVIHSLQLGNANPGEQLMAATYLIQTDIAVDVYSHCAYVLEKAIQQVGSYGDDNRNGLVLSVAESFELLIERHVSTPSAIEAAGRENLEAVKERDRLGYAVVKLVEAVDALLEAGSDEYLHDENGDFTYEEAPSDYWADLRTAADNMVLRAEDFEEKYRALMESPHTSAVSSEDRK